MTRILVTGASGFHGYHLCEALKDMGFEVYGLVRHRAQKSVLPNVKIVEADITDSQAVINVMKEVKPNIVVHLAALTPVSKSYDQPHIYMLTNYGGTINVFEAWRKVVPVQDRYLFVYASTSECYGQQERFPIYEDAICKPNTPYAVSKYAGELYVRVYGCEELREPVVVTVPFNSYGRAYVRQSHFVIEKILHTLAKGGNEVKLGDPTPIRDFLFRDDLIDAYCRLINKAIQDIERFKCQRINFCTGRGVSIAELVKIVEKVTGRHIEVEWGYHYRPADIKILIGSYWKAYRLLGWKPRYTLEEGLYQAYREWLSIESG